MQDDEFWMRRALALAEKAVGRTSPNPAVGAVIVREGHVVGEGYHERAGAPHAEVVALQAAGESARGATLYVTLEPCAHWGRTPPCTDRLIEAGIRRVVAAMEDPDPRVRGRGFAQLRAAGIEVEVGVAAAQAAALNEPFVTAKTLGRPFFLLKYAMTLDGRVATATGDSFWISSEAARQRVHQWRNRLDAVLVGVGTILRDDPLLTCRLPEGRDPVRIIADSQARTPVSARVVTIARTSSAPTVIAASRDAPGDRVAALEAAGASVWRLPAGPDGRVDLAALAEAILTQGLNGVLLEGGPELNAAAIREGLVDAVACFVAPKLIGGRQALGPLGGSGVERMANALPLKEMTWEAVGEDLLVTARRAWHVHWPRGGEGQGRCG